MFEAVYEYVFNNLDDFSLTIFYDVFSRYADLTYETTISDIYNKQKKCSLDDICIETLNWREVLAVFTAIYSQDNNLLLPSKKLADNTFLRLAKRLKQTDINKNNEKFDDRKYYVIKNIIFFASKKSMLKNGMMIFSKDGKLSFPATRHLDECSFDFSSIDTVQNIRFVYLEGLRKNGWINIFETHNGVEVLQVIKSIE